jgi:transcriptional regulator GlxA family with amidase domain
VAQVAEKVGYTSEAAFAKAFERTLGRTPGKVRRSTE